MVNAQDDAELSAETPPDPREMLALLQQQQRRVGNALMAPVAWLYGIWGVAWLVGFLALWSSRPDGNPWFSIPPVVGGWVFAALIASSIAASAIIGSRINRGVRGNSNFQGAVYGVSWSLCGTAFTLVGVGLISNGMSGDLASLYFPSAFALMCGTLYIAGAALWRDTSQLILGIVLLAVGSIAPFVGAPTNNLVMAIVGGGAFLTGAVVVAIRLHSGR